MNNNQNRLFVQIYIKIDCLIVALLAHKRYLIFELARDLYDV